MTHNESKLPYSDEAIDRAARDREVHLLFAPLDIFERRRVIRRILELLGTEQSKDAVPGSARYYRESLQCTAKMLAEAINHEEVNYETGPYDTSSLRRVLEGIDQHLTGTFIGEDDPTSQASGPVCSHDAEAGAYYEGKSYVAIDKLQALIEKWRADASKDTTAPPPIPAVRIGYANALEVCAEQLEAALNG